MVKVEVATAQGKKLHDKKGRFKRKSYEKGDSDSILKGIK